MSAKTQTLEAGPEQVQELVAQVLNDELYWFPVRHHSPRAARHVEAAILKRKPKLVFIDAPSIANELVQHVLDAKTRPPIAIYTSYRDDDNTLGLAGIESPAEDIPARFASWYPLCEYSPEYRAMKAAHKVKAKTIFIDLPYHARLKPHESEEAEDVQQNASMQEIIEQAHNEQRFYGALAEAAGYATWDQAWDNLFEFGPGMDDRERFRYELASFCAAARLTASAERMANDGTHERERHMRQSIEEALKKHTCKPSEAMVVCGGFHLFMDHTDKEAPPESPAGSVYTSVVPFSYFQMSELSGYAAGNRAPLYFHQVWDHPEDMEHDDLVAKHTVAILTHARKLDLNASSADAISISQHANMLAALRGHHKPLLEDLQDAVMTCCCKGNPAEDGLPYREAMDRAAIGNRIGKVTPKLGRLPLLIDFYDQIEKHGLSEVTAKEATIKKTLNKQDPADEATSAFLHRLRFLEVPLAQALSASGGLGSGTIFKEVWQMKWSPKVEVKLIETNLHGDTIETAAMTLLREALAKDSHSASHSCKRLREACLMALPELMRTVESICAAAIATDDRFASLTQATVQLGMIKRGLSRESATIEKLLEACYPRACFALSGTIAAPDEEHESIINGLRSLAEMVLRDKDEQFDRELLITHVRTAVDACDIPLLRGAFMGILAEMRAIPATEVSDALREYAQSRTEVMVLAGDFLHGILSVSRTSLLLGADHLVEAIDELLRAAEWDVFLVMLPRLRGAFETLQTRQRSALAEKVAQRYNLSERKELEELHTSVGAAALFARIDAQTAELLEKWNL